MPRPSKTSEEAMPSKNRPTMRELAEERNSERRKAMQDDIAAGRLTVRQMTPRERKDADARRAAFADRATTRRRTRTA
jgi:hypothetical protein